VVGSKVMSASAGAAHESGWAADWGDENGPAAGCLALRSPSQNVTAAPGVPQPAFHARRRHDEAEEIAGKLTLGARERLGGTRSAERGSDKRFDLSTILNKEPPSCGIFGRHRAGFHYLTPDSEEGWKSQVR